MADAHRILELFERVAHLGERYGAADARGDREMVKHLRDEYQIILEEVRRLIKPSQLQRMAHRSATAQMQMQQAAYTYGTRIFSDLAYEEEKIDTKIEFSL